jgi:hypothetical protein
MGETILPNVTGFHPECRVARTKVEENPCPEDAVAYFARSHTSTQIPFALRGPSMDLETEHWFRKDWPGC